MPRSVRLRRTTTGEWWNSANSIVWYDEWIRTGNRELLDRIIQYNEDDVCATYHVKKWLERVTK